MPRRALQPDGPPVVAREMWGAEMGRQRVPATPEVAELSRELLGAPRVESRWNLCRQENMRVILSLGAVDEVSRRLEEAGTPEAAQKARRLCGAAADALNEMKNGFKREKYEQRDREAVDEDTRGPRSSVTNTTGEATIEGREA